MKKIKILMKDKIMGQKIIDLLLKEDCNVAGYEKYGINWIHSFYIYGTESKNKFLERRISFMPNDNESETNSDYI